MKQNDWGTVMTELPDAWRLISSIVKELGALSSPFPCLLTGLSLYSYTGTEERTIKWMKEVV